MSLQPKTEKTDAQVRRAGARSSGGGHQQHPPRGGGGVGGHGPHNSSNTSGKRSNGPGGQTRVNPNAGSLQANASVKVQNGSHTQRQQAGQATALSGNVPLPATKQSNVMPPKSNGILPKPPMSQPSNIKSSEQTSSVTTAAISGESNRAMLQQPFAFQFGSFSPVSINGLQIPARTSSAPPNFDEQKRDQARSGAATDVPGANLSSALSGTPQRQENHPGLKQVASTLDHSAEGKRMPPGTKPGVSVVQIQDVPGGRKSSGLVFQSINPSISQGLGVVSGSLAPSSYMPSQNAPSGSRAPNSQHQSQGLASQLHVQSSQLPLQGATPGLHAHNSKVQSQSTVPSSQLQSQGNTGLHAPSSQLQSQVVTAGTYVPSSQMQSQALAPGSRPLQVPIQMSQVQQAFGSQGLPTGAMQSQGILHHGLSFPQPMRHMMQQQVNTHLPSQQFIPGNPQINAQIPIQINPQLSSSIGAHLPPYVSTPQTNQYNIPQRTSTVKITHPDTHEELKFGPKGVKSDSHADNGVVTLASDSNPLPGSLPPYGPAHSNSIPVSGLHTKNFYPSVSAPAYGHPSFQQPPKTTTIVRPSIVRPSPVQNSAPINAMDLSKQPSNAMDSLSASATSSSHSSHGSNISTIVPAKKEETQPEIHVAKVSTSNKSDAGTKQSMSITSPQIPSDVVVSNSSAVSGGNNHSSEEHNTESGNPGVVPMKEHPKKVIKSESKYKKQQNQQASLLRPSNAQVEFKVEMVAESFESGGSCPEPDKCISSQSKYKKQQQQQQQSLFRSSSNARTESKREVVADSSEAGATCREADKFGSATVSLKTAKPVDGGATAELARKAIETVLNSSSPDLSSVAHASSNMPINFSKVEKIISMSSSANISNISEISSSGVIGDLRPAFINPSSSVQHSEDGQESAITTVTPDVREEAFGVMNKFYIEKAEKENEFTEEENVNNDNLQTAENSMSNKPVPESDSNNRDEEKLHIGSETNSDIKTCINSDQSGNRGREDSKILEGAKAERIASPDLLSLPVNSSTRNEKSQLVNEEVRGNETKHADMISPCSELDNGTVVDDQNVGKDKTEEAFQWEESVGRPVQSGLSCGDDIVDSDQSTAHASKSGLDTFTRLEDASPFDVKNMDMQDKAQVLIHNSSGSEGMSSSQLLSLPVESEGKSDSLGKVQEKEIKSSSNTPSNSKSTNVGDVPKIVVNKKKKKKELLSKADAAAPTGDLYNAYKVPEKQEDVNTLEPCNVVTAVEDIPPLKETEKQVQKEVDDWEDAAELSTNVKQVTASIAESDRSGDRRYSRDFLLTFRAQFKDLPTNFEIRQDIKDLMDSQSIATHHGEGELLTNMGRAVDGQLNGNSRIEDRWTKPTDAFTGGRDMRMEMGVPGGFRPNQGYNTGFGKNMRGQPNLTGILPSGPFGQAPYPQGGLTRNNSDVDRWQRGSAFQKGLIPPPPAPSPVIHKAENRYEVLKVSDEEELKQRKIKAILNKLTPQNFDKLFLKVQEVNIDSAVCLTGVISQIFDKALMEPTFCEMYSKFCFRLAAELPEIYEDNEKVTFRRELLNKCQEEFERDEREQAEAQNAEDGEIKLSKEELEAKRVATRRRMLGNIRFIGELYKETMLTERIMHECIKKLFGEFQNPDEENVEALCKLMSTIGHMIDHLKAKDHMDAYFERITTMASNQVLPSRLRFMLKDVIDLRKNGWQQRRKVDGPKKIEEVHRDAAQERQAAAMGGRLNRTPSMGHTGRRVSTPPDHGSRGPPMQPFMAGAASGSMSHMSGMRGSQAQTGGRGFIGQDARVVERIMPLPQRPSDEGHLTLGPQGGLARGISGRAQPLPSNRSVLADGSSLSSGSNRRASLASRDEISSRTSSVEKPLLTKSGIPERNVSGSDRREYRNSYSFHDKGGKAPIAEYQQESSHGISSSQLSEEKLVKNSKMAIKEFYSSRDMEEATLCVTDLKSPWFHPTLVSLWITDSFDRKDVERDLLGNLLTHLNRTVPVVLSQEHLIKGLDDVLASLEDSVVDAPKAPQFLGRILGKLAIADIISLNDIAVLLENGGSEPGSLLEEDHALDVLGTVLEFIREKDDKTLLDLYKSSGVRLEVFMPRKKPVKVESFLEKKNIQCLSPLISRHL